MANVGVPPRLFRSKAPVVNVQGRHAKGQSPPRKNTVPFKCRTANYLQSSEMNQLRKSLFLQPEDVRVSATVPGATGTVRKLCVTVCNRV